MIYGGFVFLLAPVLPILLRLPNKRKTLIKELRAAMGGIANELLERTRREKSLGYSGNESGAEKSIIGLLSRF